MEDRYLKWVHILLIIQTTLSIIVLTDYMPRLALFYSIVWFGYGVYSLIQAIKSRKEDGI